LPPDHPEMSDTDYIRRAIAIARRGIALTSPGTLVGAVIVKNDAVVGEGFYTWDGVHHAETLALQQAGEAARGATVYTSLEPCAHTGRTPPCAKALIDAGVARVVTSMEDPYPLVSGRGLAMLKEAGIAVECGLLQDESRRMNEAFLTHVTKKRAFGILKIAMTLDGKIATATGESQWITSDDSRTEVQGLRHSVDAVITGSGTYLKDRPQLSDRTGLPRRRELLRVVLDRRGQVERVPGWLIVRGGFGDLHAELEQREIQSFVMECGPDLAFSALESGVIDKVVAFVAPRILGGREVPAVGGAGFERLADALQLRDWTVSQGDTDITITAYVQRSQSH
jgi:diaminohydroxyphosphoribosylaminopyrimidine deaminase/5-amino-6-(5-phosphoribosylamino)uracil reductase